MSKNIISILLILTVFAAAVSSCKEDDVDKNGDQQVCKGSINAIVDGQSWTAGKIIKQKFVSADDPSLSSTDLLVYNNINSSLMLFSFSPDVEQRDYLFGLIDRDIFAYVSFYADSKNSSTLEDLIEGKITVTKYSADSLVATFNFNTDTHTLTNGKIKIKHN